MCTQVWHACPQQCCWLSRASPVPPDLKRGSHAKLPSPPTPPLKPSYSQIVKTKIPPRDPEKRARDPGKVTRDSSRDPLPISVPCDQSHDQTRSRAYTPLWRSLLRL